MALLNGESDFGCLWNRQRDEYRMNYASTVKRAQVKAQLAICTTTIYAIKRVPR